MATHNLARQRGMKRIGKDYNLLWWCLFCLLGSLTLLLLIVR